MRRPDLSRLEAARQRLSRDLTWWWLGLPVMPVQGYLLMRSIPRFGDADGATGTVGSGARRMKVVALGDSVTAGYAIEHHRSSVAGQLAGRLAERHDATVEWQACASSGATAGDVIALVDQAVLHDADLIFLSVGVNDLKNLHSATRFREEFTALLDVTLATAPKARVCLLGIPPLDHFPAFPRPLADALGWRGRAFNVITTEVIRGRERAFRIDASGPLADEMFAADGFHPSTTLHAAFADAVMEQWDVPAS